MSILQKRFRSFSLFTFSWVLLFTFVNFNGIQAQCISTNAFTGTELVGGQDFTGRLGLRFTVNSPIVIYQLGVYDSNEDGITGNISVGLINDAGVLQGSSITVNGSGDPLVGHFRMRNITPFVLSPGNYTVVAHGFSAGDPNGNTFTSDLAATTNTGGGLITHLDSRSDAVANFDLPTNIHPNIGRFHAGNFTFSSLDPIAISPSIPGDICQFSNVSYGVTGTAGIPGLSYVWEACSSNNGTSCNTTGFLPNNTNSTPSRSWDFDGVKSIKVSISKTGCPTISDTLAFNVITKPRAGDNQLNVCGGTNAIITGSLPGTGSWAAQSGNPVGATLITGLNLAIDTVSFTPTASGQYNFIYTANTCTDTMAITVTPLPILQTTINGVQVTNINDGNSDVGSFSVCNSPNNNIFFTQFVDLVNTPPSGASVKVRQEFSLTNVTFGPVNATVPLSAFPASFDRNVSLIVPTTSGTLVMRFRVFYDNNNNDNLDPGECVGDSIVYTVTVNPQPNAGGDQTNVCAGSSTIITGSTASTAVWSAQASNPLGATLVGPGVNPAIDTVTFSRSATAGPYNFIYSANGCADTMAISVTPLPTLQTLINGVSVSTNNDGNNDTGSFSVCSGKPVPNINVTSFSTTGGSSVKIFQQIIFTNASQSGAWCLGGPTCVAAPGGFSGITNTFSNVGLSPGTVVLKFLPFVDTNNNSIIEASECAGDTVVYTITVNPQPDAGGPQTACRGGRAFMAGSGTGSWTAQTGNPGTAIIVNPTSPTTAITSFSNPGSYNFIFTDALGCSDTANVTVSPTVITCLADTIVNILTPLRCDTTINLRVTLVTACTGHTMVGPYINGVLMPGATSANFTAGTMHFVSYSIYDPTGFRLDSCVRKYTINDFKNESLACQQIQASLGGDCKDTLTVREVLVGWDRPDPLLDLLGCDSLYKINVKNSIGQNLGPILSSNEIDKILTYTVTHPSGFSCSSTVEVKDKIKPTVICPTSHHIVNCLEDLTTIAAPSAIDNCPGAKVILVDLKHIPLPCDPIYIGKIARTWIAEDARGLRSDANCTDSIFILRSTFVGIVPAANDTLRCNEDFPDDGRGTGYPHPSFTGVPMYNSKSLWPQSQLDLVYCNAMINYEDRLVLESQCKTRIQRIWTITEWWCNTSVIIPIGMQFIDIIDDIKPSIPALSDMTISTESRSCKGRLTLPALNITDNCSSVYNVIINAVRTPGGTPTGFINGNGGTMTLDTGMHLITYKAFDICGNDSSMTFKVLVTDDTDPVALCDELATVSLKPNGYTEITAAAVNDGSYDECGPVTIKIRRMEDPCDFGDDTGWFDKVGFCCADGDQTRMVQLQVTDHSGNTNLCMVSVRIQNKVIPTIACPANQTKPCDFTFDPSNLKDYFGEALITGSECVEPSSFRDVIETDSMNQCGIGFIIRRISLPENAGSCTQRIDFIGINPVFGPSNITWPRDTTIIGQCSAVGLDTSALGAPRFTEGFCSMVGMNYTDEVFPFTTNGACFKIIRKWKVIDWCQPSTSTPPVATWTWEQEIKIMDNNAPIMNLPVNLTFGSTSCTSSDVEIIATATDCTPQDDLRWNYSVFKGSTLVSSGTNNAITDEFELGDYKVIWRVDDRCGNRAVDSMNFRVVTTKTASAICKNGLASSLTHMDTNGDAIPDTYMARLTPAFFDNKSAHSCDSLMPLKLSFSSNVNDTVRNYICDSVGRRTVRMYVTDIYGNQSFCETFVDIQATAAECPGFGQLIVTVSGRAAKENNETIEEVIVDLKGSEMPSIKTKKDGLFNFGAMPVGGKYQIVPGKDGDDMNGVSTLDAVIIQRHILGIETLKTPYQMIAADANRSGSVTASDITELRKLLLGINTSFQNNTSWRFVDASYRFANSNNPWQSVFPENYNIENLNSNMDINFIGIKVGDVNGNAKASNLNETVESRSSYDILVDDTAVKKGDKLTIPVKINEPSLLYGVQMKFAAQGLYVSQILDGDHQWNYTDGISTNPNDIKFNSVAADGIKGQNGEHLLVLKGEALQDGKLSKMLALDPQFKSEVYTDGLESKKLIIQWRDKVSQEFVLSGVVPNPWNNNTSISFQLPADGTVSMRIMDYTGRSILTSSEVYQSGTNTITINKSDIGNAGVYLYELRYNDKVLSGKMIVID